MENTTKPVLVTGATGFLASHIILELLKRKYKVRSTVRSLKDPSKFDHLFTLVPHAKEYLELVEADLLKESSWDNAVKGCDIVLHVASPFPSTVPKDETEIIKPAVQGTLNVLSACAKNGVKKVVLTSSVAAVICGNERSICTEDDWSSETACPPYEKSKLLAEEAAWKFYNQNKDKFELTVLCPGLLWGPIINSNSFTSGEIVLLIMKGQLPAIPNLTFPIADVRDAAIAHIRAMEKKETNGKRYLIVSETVSAEQTVNILRKEFARYGYRFPILKVGKLAATLASFYNPMFKLFLSVIGHRYEISNKKSVEELGIDYIPVQRSLVDLVYSMMDKKIIQDKRRPRAKL